MTARLWIFSDLHQDWPENAWNPAPAGGFDVAIVAGDVHMPLLRALDWLAERLPGVPTVYVPGNHDFWWDRGEERYTIHDQIARGRDRAEELGIPETRPAEPVAVSPVTPTSKPGFWHRLWRTIAWQ